MDSFRDAITKGAGESFAFPPVFPPIATSLGNSPLTRTNELAVEQRIQSFVVARTMHCCCTWLQATTYALVSCFSSPNSPPSENLEKRGSVGHVFH